MIGDFGLRPAERGFGVAPEEPLHLGPWDKQGHPFYSAGISYGERFDLSVISGRYLVTLAAWYGSVAKVVVNGKTAGYIAQRPWQCDVTPWLRPGSNSIELVVIGTLKNTLGPHHGEPALGTAWPGMFQKAPSSGLPAGTKYHTVSYGLFGPFVLKHAIPAAKQAALLEPNAARAQALVAD